MTTTRFKEKVNQCGKSKLGTVLSQKPANLLRIKMN